MKRYEISIKILDKDYVNSLVIALVRQGYDVYYNADEGVVCYDTDKEEIREIKEKK